MKKSLIIFGSAAFLLTSCGGGPDKAAYEAAADKVCGCMDTKTEADAQDTSEFKIDMTSLNFASCALDVVFDVDPFSDEMGEQINAKCPQWKAAHAEYQKNKEN